MKCPFFTAAVVLAALLLECQGREILRVPLGNDGSTLEVTSVFDTLPPTGYAPLHVKLINNSAEPRSITARNTSRTDGGSGSDVELESSFSLTSPPTKTTERDFIVPLCTDVSQSSYSGHTSLSAVIQISGRTEALHVSGGGYYTMPFTAFSDSLAAKSIGDINRTGTAGSSSPMRYGNPAFATLYDVSMLPSEWKGYAGLDGLAITSDEWAALQPGVRSAVLQWVKLGGVLDLYAKSGAPSFPELGIKDTVEHGRLHDGAAFLLGRGMVCRIEWNGKELDGNVANHYTASRLGMRQSEASSALAEKEKLAPEKTASSDGTTPLVTALGDKSFAAWQVGMILFVFGIVVGPVNLFYFARAGRRHRLFFTTPVISIAAAVLLLVVIFFQDGLGGTGHRASIVYLDAADGPAYVHQYQVCRTGVLFGGTFTTEEPAAINMAVMPDTRWTRLKAGDNNPYSYYRRSSAETQRYSVAGDSYGGDWFQSRTEQAQIIDAVQSTRGRVELKPGSGAPIVISSLKAPLHRIFYIDGEGKYWASPGAVTTGASVTLTSSGKAEFEEWHRDAVSAFPAEVRSSLAGITPKNFFYAVSSDPAAGTVATLNSIDWKSDRVFLYGPLR